jgi:hypothetical protein
VKTPFLRLLAALAAEDDRSRLWLCERLVRDTKPARRRALAPLWC